MLFILLPFLSSLLQIYFLPALPRTLGFSAIICGFIGYLPYAIFNYLKNILKFSLKSSFVLLIFFLNNIIIVFFNLKIPSMDKFIMTFILSVLFIYFTYVNRLGIKQMMSVLAFDRIKNLFKDSSFALAYRLLLISLAMIYLFLLLPALIPPEITIGNSLINIFSHYIGYTFGIFMPLTIESLKWVIKKLPRID
jgi:hypothetical protein